MNKGGRPPIFSDEEVKRIVDMVIDGRSVVYIAKALGRPRDLVGEKIKTLRKRRVLPSFDYAYPWTLEEDEAFIKLWNENTLSISEMALRFRRSDGAVKTRVVFWRQKGLAMRSWSGAPREDDGIIAPRFPPFTMPPGMRFEDDPRAVLDMGSAYMPRRPDVHYGASSLVGSGRLLNVSGKNGAVA